MAKLLKILGRTFGGIIEWTLILFIAFAFLIRTSPVQTYLAGKATEYLSKELHARVKVDKVAIIFFDQVALDGVLIEDQQGDTLLSAERLIVNLDDIDLKNTSYTIAEAKLRSAYVHIQRSEDNVFNHAFLREYFVKEKKKKSDVKFKLRFADFSDTRFDYDDHRKERRETGMDYFHLSTKDISGKISNLNYEKDTISATIQGLSAKEKSGFVLNCFSAEAKVSPKGVLLNDVEIITADSWIRSSKFNMLSDSYNGFKYFVDSVRFDGQIDESDVSLKEVAYFAYVLEGMEDRVRVKSRIKSKVAKLRLRDFELRYSKKTYIKADLNISDYRNFKKELFSERVDSFYIDLKELKQLKLPNNSPERYIELNPEVERLQFLEGTKVSVDGGFKEFVFLADRFKTALGSAHLNYGMKFIETDRDSYIFKTGQQEGYDFTVYNFELGKYLGNTDVGIIDGSFNLEGEAFSTSDIDFTSITGTVNTFEYLNYPYNDIRIKEGKFQHDKFEGEVEVYDEYLALHYKGAIDFVGEHNMNFTVTIDKSDLERLNISSRNAELLSKIKVDISGKNLNSYHGSIQFDDFKYTTTTDGVTRTFDMDQFILTIERFPEKDVFTIDGTAGKAELSGKIKLDQLVNNFHYQFSKIFPALYGESAQDYATNTRDDFTYNAEFYNPNNFVRLFYPDLHIAPKTKISGYYKGETSTFELNLDSDSIQYGDLRFKTIDLEQSLSNDRIAAIYKIAKFSYSDSLEFSNIDFKTEGGDNILNHRLTWDYRNQNTSELSWDTDVHDMGHFGFVLNPSHFFIRDHRWDITHESSLRVKSDTINISNFALVRNSQKVVIDGRISNQDSHRLNFTVTDLELAEISPFITTDYPMSGIINLNGHISNPFNNLGYIGNGTLKNFVVNNQKVGDINVKSEWDKAKQSIRTNGDLSLFDEKTFEFDGDYFLYKEEDNLDFDLNFDYTNLQFTNAFMDPDVMSDIKGFINGHLALTGSPENPVLDGVVDLTSGSARIDILGVHFGVDGPVEVDQYGMYINGIPVYDEDGNSGLLIGSVFHDNYQNFNFDLQFDLESQQINTLPVFGAPEYSRFLVMNLPYEHDALYYGKGYVTGNANIFGYTDNLEITVDFKTMPGTTINIPMFGVGEIEQEEFIKFTTEKKDSVNTTIETPYDLTGVHLDLNFEATRDANINIIFNEEIGDVISANGQGDISMTLDNLGDVRMEGTYEVHEGVYNFAMNPVSNSPIAVKQTFIIEEGGRISWLGDPYDAQLDLRTYYKLTANLSEISGNSDLGSTGGAHQTVYSYLNLSGSMEEPEIQFDIEAPQADDIGKTLIQRIKSDKDELSRQFFSLMLARRFQPIAGSASGNGGGALDLLTNQVNAMLSRISEEYIIKVDFDNDMISGDNTYEFGVSKGFLNDRLILSGSFGVENYGQQEISDNGEVSTGQLIGDINLEYVINESGTFRVNIFNESTDKTIIQESGQGDFTQGAGLSYKEDFESFDDFKLVQYVLDVFRKKENKRYPKKGKRHQRPVPEEDIIKPEDQENP